MIKEGVILGKRYEIISRIGSGGMADVYKGKDHKLNRYVAVKVLKSDFRTDEVFIQKFLTEAQSAAGLMHPNVVNVYDVGQDRGLYYMVMELVEGITLKEYIEKKGKLSASETISISIQMVSGIQAAHNQHIVHRDIKPQNIIISKEGKVKVTDFGIARATTSSNTISANVMGSVHYTSPEQARGGVVDEKSDIYSAGITMYEMITGHVPFDGDSTVSVAIKHLQEEIISPSEEVPDIPFSLDCIIMKCCEKNPEKRYHDCQALITDLKHSLVDPEGDFVTSSYAQSRPTDETVVMPTEEMERIQERGYSGRDTDYDSDDEDDDGDDEDDYDYPPQRGRGPKSSDTDPNTKKIAKILMIVAAVIVAFALIFFVARAAGAFKNGSNMTNTSTSKKVEVPDVVGMTEEAAKKELNGKSLGYSVNARKESDKYEKGIVMAQETASGDKVKKNTEIKVTVSSGIKAQTVKVPDVVGTDESDAQKTLERAGLIVTDSTAQYDDKIAKGKVISTNPSADTEVKEGSEIKMVVSLGAEKVKVEKAAVPNVVGSSAADADAALTAVGLVSGSVTEVYSDTVEAGLVVSQATKADSEVDKGTAVDYKVSKGAEVKMITVPSLSGMTKDQAASALEAAGLTAGDVTEEYNSNVTEGYVVSQTAPADSQVATGTAIGYVISLGAEPVTPDNPDQPTDGGGTDNPGSGDSTTNPAG